MTALCLHPVRNFRTCPCKTKSNYFANIHETTLCKISVLYIIKDCLVNFVLVPDTKSSAKSQPSSPSRTMGLDGALDSSDLQSFALQIANGMVRRSTFYLFIYVRNHNARYLVRFSMPALNDNGPVDHTSSLQF